MTEFQKLIRGYLDERTRMLHTAILGEVTRLDGTTADVRPLQGGYPMLIGLPMIDIPRGYEVGDRVLVVFLERARDGVGERKHSLEDGVIVGVLM